MPRLTSKRASLIVAALFICATCLVIVRAQQTAPTFGGAYSALDERRQALVRDWVARFVKTTGQPVDPAAFYDDAFSISAKTTFEAVTHALMTTRLTDASGASLGDALAIVEHVDFVRGEVAGAPGDHQFRMYVRLVPSAVQTLGQSQEFKRGVDNSVYHKGYPVNYRAGGVPSVQVSIARDGRRADIDVDYRSASFPVGLFNGHLTSSNSDVRAGSNYDRHINRWAGFQNWWRSFFGVHQDRAPEVESRPGLLSLPTTPRVGKKDIDVMVNDFLKAWLIEGDVMAAMSYISARSYACLAQDSDKPTDFDVSMAPRQLAVNLTSAPEPVPTPKAPRIRADPTLVQAARGFLEDWLVRKNYDAAFAGLSSKAYACYDLERDPENPASTSPEDAGR